MFSETFENQNWLAAENWTTIQGTPTRTNSLAVQGLYSFQCTGTGSTLAIISTTITDIHQVAPAISATPGFPSWDCQVWFFDDMTTTAHTCPYFTVKDSLGNYFNVGVCNDTSTTNYACGPSNEPGDGNDLSYIATVARTTGWHKFVISAIPGGLGVAISIDGTVTLTASLPNYSGVVSQIFLCSGKTSTTVGTFGYFDSLFLFRDQYTYISAKPTTNFQLYLCGLDSLTAGPDDGRTSTVLGYVPSLNSQIQAIGGNGGPGLHMFDQEITTMIAGVTFAYGGSWTELYTDNAMSGGTLSTAQSWSLNTMGWELQSNGAYLTWDPHATYATVKIFYLQQPGGGTFSYGFTGGTTQTQSTAGTLAVKYVNLNYTSGTTSITMTQTTSSTNVDLYGAYFTNTSGAVASPIARTGGDFTTWTLLNTTGLEQWTTALKPAGLLFNGGTNDSSTMTSGNYQTGLQNLITAYRSGAPLTRIVLLGANQKTGNVELNPFKPQMITVASLYACQYINNVSILGNFTAANAAGYMYGDGVHPSTTGSIILATYYSTRIGVIPLPAGTGTSAPSPGNGSVYTSTWNAYPLFTASGGVVSGIDSGTQLYPAPSYILIGQNYPSTDAIEYCSPLVNLYPGDIYLYQRIAFCRKITDWRPAESTLINQNTSNSGVTETLFNAFKGQHTLSLQWLRGLAIKTQLDNFFDYCSQGPPFSALIDSFNCGFGVMAYDTNPGDQKIQLVNTFLTNPTDNFTVGRQYRIFDGGNTVRQRVTLLSNDTNHVTFQENLTQPFKAGDFICDDTFQPFLELGQNPDGLVAKDSRYIYYDWIQNCQDFTGA